MADETALPAEGLWRLTVEHSPVGMALVAVDGTIVSVNRALQEMLGRADEDLVGRTFRELTHPDDLDVDVEHYERVLAGEVDSYRLTKRYLRADGSVVWGDLSAALLRDASGAPVHFIGQVVDVSAQHGDRDRLARALEVIRQQRRTAEAILDTVDVGLVLLDQEGRYVALNRHHREFMALAYPDGHGGAAGQLGAVFAGDGSTRMTREQMPTWRAAQGEEFDDERIWVGEDPLVRRALSVSARTVRDGEGGFAGAALAYKDVTDLVQALQVKDDFVAEVSHELRTPLAALLAHVEMLARREDLDEDARGHVQAAARNSARLRSLVADLIETSQVQAGTFRLRRADCDLGAVVGEAVRAAAAAAAAARVEVAVGEQHAPLVVRADAGRVRQVLDNLISNAVKYTDPGGRVVVTLRLDETADQAVLTVADTGIGIAPEDHDRVFERFYRSRPAQRRPVPGVGLGLSVVRALVAAHGGRVDVASSGGGGTTFVVRLPRSSPRDPALPA